MSKKKIIIFTSSGGQGHISATKAIQSYLGNEYAIKPVYIFNEVFKNIDPSSVITFGKINGEDIYNFFLRRRWYSILNVIYRIGNWYFGLQSKAMTRIATEYLKKENPDLIISVTPIINNVILAAAQGTHIPFLLVPTDFDVTTFVRGLGTSSQSQFHVCLGLDDPMVKATAESAPISSNQISLTGLPVRSDFFEAKDIPALKKQYLIPSQKQIIVVMMGGQGNSSILAFAKQLATLTFPVHIIFCIGKNTTARHHLESLEFNKNISITIQGFTDRISDLLAIADLLITKSGSVSFSEALYMNVPMILDATATVLYWERLNHILLTEHDWGICLKKVTHLNAAVTAILGHPEYQQAIKKRLENFPKQRLDIKIKPILEELLS